MTLLLRRVQITAQHLVDRHLERLQPRRGPHRYLAWRRDRTRQRLPHHAPVHPVLGRKLPNRQPLDPRIASDRGEQLHPRSHPSTPSVITNRLVITVKWATSSRHNRPGVSASGPNQAVTTTSTRPPQVGPLQTVTVGPTQAVTANGLDDRGVPPSMARVALERALASLQPLRRLAEAVPVPPTPAQPNGGANRPSRLTLDPPLWLRTRTATWVRRWPDHARGRLEVRAGGSRRGGQAGNRPHY